MVILPAQSDTAWIWSSATSAPEQVPLGQHARQQELTAACWSMDDSCIAFGASKGAVIILAIAQKKVVHNLQGVHERV